VAGGDAGSTGDDSGTVGDDTGVVLDDDAGGLDDASAADGSLGPGADSPDRGGCSCTFDAHAVEGGWIALGLVALAVARRRR
jgi:hypothetical protein